MKLRIVLRTAGIFFAVSAATFVATDPAALPDWAKAAIGASIAGLAAIGITPPANAPLNIIQRQWGAIDRTHTVVDNLARRVSTVEDEHTALAGDHDQLELDHRALYDHVVGNATPTPTPPLTVAPEPEPPAPEVPS